LTDRIDINQKTTVKTFLALSIKWQKELLGNIYSNNEKLSTHELNFATENIILGIIFLRMYEDRGIEPFGQLKAVLKGENNFRGLLKLFYKVDKKYNTDLLYSWYQKNIQIFSHDLFTNLKLGNHLLELIITGLYSPGNFKFSKLPIDILGQVHEELTERSIEIINGRTVVIKKSDVKKTGGVYYTPGFIVDRIINDTLGRLVKGKSPKEISRIRVLDPACGSGSFLLAAYKFLLNWRLNYYIEKGCGKRKFPLFKNQSGQWRLTNDERISILKNNIFGVDIDYGAVRTLKHSLVLMALGEQDKNRTSRDRSAFDKEDFPDLGENIKWGNSLIDTDFINHNGLDTNEIIFKNHFSWKDEFPKIRRAGWFDVVIGNPPYIDSQWMSRNLPEERKYICSKYKAAKGNWDIFCVFIEKSLELSRKGGYVSLIVPNKLGSAEYAAGARAVIAQKSKILSVRDYSKYPVFSVAVYPIVFLLSPGRQSEKAEVYYERIEKIEDKAKVTISKRLKYKEYFHDPAMPWPIFSNFSNQNLFRRILSTYPPLKDYCEIRGAATVNEAYRIKELISCSENVATKSLKFINSGAIDPYRSLWRHKAIRYLNQSYELPIIRRKDLHCLPKMRRKQAESQKIIVAGMTRKLECYLDDNRQYLAGKSTTVIFSEVDLRYLVGILNSTLITYIYKNLFGGDALAGGYLRIGPPQLKKIPIRIIDSGSANDIGLHEELITYVDKIISLYKNLGKSKKDHQNKAVMKEIETIDQSINQIVFTLYQLTEKEIRSVMSD